MLGAIIGDIVGSRFEFHNIKTKKFKLFTKDSCPTDDSIMTAAVDECLLNGYKNPKIIVKFTKSNLPKKAPEIIGNNKNIILIPK